MRSSRMGFELLSLPSDILNQMTELTRETEMSWPVVVDVCETATRMMDKSLVWEWIFAKSFSFQAPRLSF